MPICLIAALDRNHAIGRGGAMPWHLPDDLKRFKALTLGKPVLMGRTTALAIGRALPGRMNLVLTRGDAAPFSGQVVVHSLDAAIAQAAHGGALKTATTQPTHGKHHKHKHLKKKAAKNHHHKAGKKGLKSKARKSTQA